MNIISILPIDCISEILKIIDTIDVCKLIFVCKDFQNIIKETTLILNFRYVIW